MQGNLNIKKQALLNLIESYLKRRGPEDIFYMEKSIKTVDNLAANINCDLDLGLSITNVLENEELYGSNFRTVTQDRKWEEFNKIVQLQLWRSRCIILLVTVILQFICGVIWRNTVLKSSAIFIFVLILISLLIKIFMKWRSFTFLSKENHGKKQTNVYVYRDGERFHITESQIKVGDVLFIDFNQTIPVSGVLISPVEITVDEDFIGRGVQKKLTLWHCLKQIENKNQLQLKIDFQNMTLPSPILLRGSKPVHGGNFKMLVLAVEQTQLLSEYYTTKEDNSAEKSILEEWIGSTCKDLQHISQVCFIIIFLFHFIAMVFKVLGLPNNEYEALMTNILDTLHLLLVCNFLLDAKILVELLKGEYLRAVTLVDQGEQLDKLLSVQQIIIADENICKYDDIIPKKIVVCEMHEPVEVKLLPVMQEKYIYNILYEIMGGVELADTLPQKISNKFHNNCIVHVNNSQEKIFSSLYQACNSTEHLNAQQQDEGDSVAELIKQNKHLSQLQTEKINKVNPDPSNSVLSSSMSNDCSLNLYQASEKIKRTEKQVKLEDYLGKHCQFSTQNIIEGLNKLAKNPSRTYYFQKYSYQRLDKAKYIWNTEKFISIRQEDKDRIIQGVKKLQREDLTVYLIGIDQGAFSNQYMSFLFGAIGVEVNQDSKIIQKLKNLQRIGIRSLITVFKNNFEVMSQLQKNQYEYDFRKRGWLNENQHFCKLEEIKKIGGRIICRICLLSKCECRPKAHELSNIQGFLQAIEEVKCLYNLTEEDIEYLELGFQQLNKTTLRIIDRKQDAIGKVNQIIVGHQLMTILQENLSFWILLLLLTFFFYFPVNYITFGHVFCNEQLYFYFIYIQILLLRNSFMKNSEEVINQEKRSLSRRKKNLFGWAIKGDIAIFLLLVMVSCIAVLFLPKLFISDDLSSYFHEYQCHTPPSFYHNPVLKVYACQKGDNHITIYPKLQTFIFLITILSITFKTFFSAHKILTLVNIAFHLSLIGILMLFVYVFPNLIHLSISKLTFIELCIAFLIAFSIVFLSKFNRWIISTLEGDKRFQLSLNLSIAKRYNEYAQILKQYKEKKTLKYEYEEL